MKFTLEDQVVLITGGSQGLGKEFAKKYYNEAENTKIIIVSRSEARLLDTCNEIRIEAHLRRETTDEGQVQHKLAAPLDNGYFTTHATCPATNPWNVCSMS